MIVAGNLPAFFFCESSQNVLLTCPYSSLMQMMQEIINVTTFVQMSACAMELAVSMFQLEYVSFSSN